MSPEEICRQLGEDKTRAMFFELTSDGMKKVLRESKIPTTRMASHTSTRRRNEDWAAKLWRAITERASTASAAALLFEWLTRARRPMLAEFLTGIDVQHEGGLTDADFMSAAPPEKLRDVGKKLLDHYDRREVAAYLLFLDASNKSEVFAELALAGELGVSG
jgi:hypothetical protein